MSHVHKHSQGHLLRSWGHALSTVCSASAALCGCCRAGGWLADMPPRFWSGGLEDARLRVPHVVMKRTFLWLLHATKACIMPCFRTTYARKNARAQTLVNTTGSTRKHIDSLSAVYGMRRRCHCQCPERLCGGTPPGRAVAAHLMLIGGAGAGAVPGEGAATIRARIRSVRRGHRDGCGLSHPPRREQAAFHRHSCGRHPAT